MFLSCTLYVLVWHADNIASIVVVDNRLSLSLGENDGIAIVLRARHIVSGTARDTQINTNEIAIARAPPDLRVPAHTHTLPHPLRLQSVRIPHIVLVINFARDHRANDPTYSMPMMHVGID